VYAKGIEQTDFTCILCVNDYPVSEATVEHIFPEALGGVLTIQALCKPCNDLLGHTCDAQLANHRYVQWARKRLQLAGRNGRVPNPLESGRVLGAPSRKIRWEPDGRIYAYPHIEESASEVHVMVDERDANHLPQILAKVQARRGAEVLVHGSSQKIVDGGMVFELGFDDTSYQLGLIKIVYELTCWALGVQYLADPVAGHFRSLLRPVESSAASARLRGRVGGLYSGPMLPTPSNYESELVGLVFPEPSQRQLVTYVRIFDRFDATFTVSNHARQFGVDTNGRGIVVDAAAGSMREIGLAEVGGAWFQPTRPR